MIKKLGLRPILDIPKNHSDVCCSATVETHYAEAKPSFREYVRRRDLREEFEGGQDPSDKFRFGSEGNEVAEDHEKVQIELFKTVLRKYPNETIDFLNTIASRGDQEISNLLRKLKKDSGPTLPKQPQHPTEGDEVVPSSADTGHNPDAGGEE